MTCAYLIQVQIGETEEVQSVFAYDVSELNNLIFKIAQTENTILNVQGLGPVFSYKDYMEIMNDNDGLNFGKEE